MRFSARHRGYEMNRTPSYPQQSQCQGRRQTVTGQGDKGNSSSNVILKDRGAMLPVSSQKKNS